MRRILMVTLIAMFATFAIAAPATSASQQFITLTHYDGQSKTRLFSPTGEIVTIDAPALGSVSPGPYPYEFDPTEPLHVYLQIRHFLWNPEEGFQNNLTINLDNASILEANILLPLPYWYPGSDGIDLIDLGTVPAGTHNITMSAALPNYYAMDWWKILVAVEVVKTIHEVSAAGQTFYIATATGSDSTITNLMFDETFVHDGRMGLISFDVTGPPDTTGFCTITIPKNLTRVGIGESWLIKVNGVGASYSVDENATHTWLYFTYPHNVHIEISGTWVVPEFPATLLLPLLIIVTLAAVILRKKLWSTKHRNTTSLS